MKQPLIEHLHELRRRLMIVAGGVLLTSLVAFMFHGQILAWLEAPLHTPLYYTKVTGAFEFIVQSCLLAGVLAAAPLLTYHLIAFVRPAFARQPRPRVVAGVIASSLVCITAGVLFGYYVSLPAALGFLGSIEADSLHPIITADSYLTFVMSYLAIFALVFLFPLVLWFVDYIRPIPPAAYQAARKWVIVGAFGACLILPVAPDPLSQFLLAMPVIVMYELTVRAIWLRHYVRARRRPQAVAVINAPVNT